MHTAPAGIRLDRQFSNATALRMRQEARNISPEDEIPPRRNGATKTHGEVRMTKGGHSQLDTEKWVRIVTDSGRRPTAPSVRLRVAVSPW
jgi:hypothetical protein